LSPASAAAAFDAAVRPVLRLGLLDVGKGEQNIPGFFDLIECFLNGGHETILVRSRMKIAALVNTHILDETVADTVESIKFWATSDVLLMVDGTVTEGQG
jgi:hypothetical protein